MDMNKICERVRPLFARVAGDMLEAGDGKALASVEGRDKRKPVGLFTALEAESGIRFGFEDRLNIRTSGDLYRADKKNHHA
ncbi:MAG TPA: hypothetical protein VE870_10680 [Bacteroidales bacterium]|nr:hypothetical protein [Bacteroidales bacterium]